MGPYTPLSCYLPLKAKLLLLGVAATVVIVGVALGLAVLIDWVVAFSWTGVLRIP